MAFIDQVQDLTSLSLTGDTDELTQFLRDGVIEVTNRCIQANEAEASKFNTTLTLLKDSILRDK